MLPVINYLKNKSNIDHNKVLFESIVTTKSAVKAEEIRDYDSFMDINHSLGIMRNAFVNGAKIPNNVDSEIEEFVQLLLKKAA
jgi:uncharacterized protein affecting Mg2+/Co2+ transport